MTLLALMVSAVALLVVAVTPEYFGPQWEEQRHESGRVFYKWDGAKHAVPLLDDGEVTV